MKSYIYLLLFLLTLFEVEATNRTLKSEALIGGKKPKTNAAKYLVSLQYEDKDKVYEHFCGAGILDDLHLLTAAHCLINDNNEFDNKSIKVVAGANDLRNHNANVVIVGVDKIYVPEEYNNAGWTTSVPLGDIAVLKMNQSLRLKESKNLKKLRLPRAKKYQKYSSYEGERVLIAGFGWDKVKVKTRRNKTEYEVGSSTDKLMSANAKVIGNDECQEYYIDTIHVSELCAKITEHDDDTPQGVCRGDSGSPLVYKPNTVIGVVSGVAIGCNENDQPGIYCRVSSYMTFIRNAMSGITDHMRIKTF